MGVSRGFGFVTFREPSVAQSIVSNKAQSGPAQRTVVASGSGGAWLWSSVVVSVSFLVFFRGGSGFGAGEWKGDWGGWVGGVKRGIDEGEVVWTFFLSGAKQKTCFFGL